MPAAQIDDAGTRMNIPIVRPARPSYHLFGEAARACRLRWLLELRRDDWWTSGEAAWNS
jgi:hypothetical protein